MSFVLDVRTKNSETVCENSTFDARLVQHKEFGD